MGKIRRLLVVTHVVHFLHEGKLFAYGPYTREMDIWADLFEEVVIAAPIHEEAPPGDSLCITGSNVSVSAQRETGGDTLLLKFTQILSLPSHFFRLGRDIMRSDAVQVRCPGNLGLLGLLLTPIFGKPRVCKYAGQWNASDAEPLSWRLQKWILRSKWWNAPVLVYGDWPGQPRHVQPMFTSILDEGQMEKAKSVVARDWAKNALEIVFVGRLSEAKNVHVLIKAVSILREQGTQFRLRIVGDGPMRKQLEELVLTEKLGSLVEFEGALPQEGVFDYYERSDILVLASQTEGWPKAIAEAMAFGLVCIGSNRGLVPQMLGGGRGLLVEPGDAKGLADTLMHLERDRAMAGSISKAAAKWGQQFTLEGLREAIKAKLELHWGTKLSPSKASSNARMGEEA